MALHVSTAPNMPRNNPSLYIQRSVRVEGEDHAQGNEQMQLAHHGLQAALLELTYDGRARYHQREELEDLLRDFAEREAIAGFIVENVNVVLQYNHASECSTKTMVVRRNLSIQ